MNQTGKGWGKRIRETRQRAGISQAELGNILGLSVATINRIENGHSVPDAQLIAKIAYKFNIGVNYLVLGKPENDHEEIQNEHPLYSESDIISGKFKERISNSWVKLPQIDHSDNCFLLITKEVGMKPIIEPGDMLITIIGEPDPSDIVVFLDNSGVVSIRKLGRANNGDEFFVAENPEYPRIKKTNEIIIGKIIGGLRYYKT